MTHRNEENLIYEDLGSNLKKTNFKGRNEIKTCTQQFQIMHEN